MRAFLPLLLAACEQKDGPNPVDPAEVQLSEDTAAVTSVVQAGVDDQEMGCLNMVSAVNFELSAMLAWNQGLTTEGDEEVWLDNPAGDFYDRTNINLVVDGEDVSTLERAEPTGELRFEMRETPVEIAEGEHQLCLEGNPGATLGTFRYIVYPDGIAASTDLGSATTFPLAFSEFRVE